eukprot:6207784-Pleurochrysis_carterae.AAC.1
MPCFASSIRPASRADVRPCKRALVCLAHVPVHHARTVSPPRALRWAQEAARTRGAHARLGAHRPACCATDGEALPPRLSSPSPPARTPLSAQILSVVSAVSDAWPIPHVASPSSIV